MERKHWIAGSVILAVGVGLGWLAYDSIRNPRPAQTPNPLLPEGTGTPQSEVSPTPWEHSVSPDPASPDGWSCLRVQSEDPYNNHLDGNTSNDLPDRPIRIIRDLRGQPPMSNVPDGQGPYRVIAVSGKDTTVNDYGFIGTLHGYVYTGDLVCVTDQSISGTIFDADKDIPVGFDERVIQNIEASLAKAGYQLASEGIPAEGTIFDPQLKASNIKEPSLV